MSAASVAPVSPSLRVLHLSDTHLFGDAAARHQGVVDTAAALDRVLARAATIDRVDVVVCSGDLSDDGTAASYERLRDRVGPWAAERGAEVVWAMGNHDGRDGFEQVLGARHGVRTVRGVRVVHLDSSVPGHGHGEVGPGQLAWLQGVLAQRAEHGTLVVVHHPPTPAYTALLARLELSDPAALLAVCGAGDVRAVLSGHYHHPVATREAGIPVLVAPGVANTTDVLADPARERATRGSGFAVVDLPLAGGDPRVTVVAVPAPGDGDVLFDLTPEQVASIGDEYGAPA